MPCCHPPMHLTSPQAILAWSAWDEVFLAPRQFPQMEAFGDSASCQFNSVGNGSLQLCKVELTFSWTDCRIGILGVRSHCTRPRKAPISVDVDKVSLEDQPMTVENVALLLLAAKFSHFLRGAPTRAAHGVAACAHGATDTKTKPKPKLSQSNCLELLPCRSFQFHLAGPIQALALPHIGSGKHAASQMQ